MDNTEIRENYRKLQERIAAAAARAGRDPDGIMLVGVTKTFPAETITAAYAAGIRHFGENRAWEIEEKRPQVEAELGEDSGLVWHFIGALQSRKTNTVADFADVFHALDRMKIARRLSKRLAENGRFLPTFVQVNVSGEGSKSGFDAENWEDDATQREKLRKAIQDAAQLPGLQLRGLMTMAPWGVAGERIRTVFRRTRELRDWLQDQLPGVDLSQLSMGMTDDFEIAIEEGATHIRVGRAIFGERDHP